jgi:hypothetical protein
MGTHGIEDWMDMLSYGGHCRREKSPGRTLVLAVICQPLTTATNPVGICGGQSGTETFLSEYVDFTLSLSLDKQTVLSSY